MALGDGDTWDETAPTDNTLANQEDDYNRDLRKGVRSRMAIEHEWPDSQSATAQAGAHKYITLQNQAAKPTLSGTQVAGVYTKTVGSGLQELFFEDEAGGELQLTDGTALSGLSKNRARIVGTSTLTITATALESIMTADFTCAGRPIIIQAQAPMRGIANGYGFYALYIDSVNVTGEMMVRTLDSSIGAIANPMWMTTPSSGSHSAELYWRAGHPTYNINQNGTNEPRLLIVNEL